MDQLLEFLREYTEFFEKMEQTQVEKLGLLMTKKLEKIEASIMMQQAMDKQLENLENRRRALFLSLGFGNSTLKEIAEGAEGAEQKELLELYRRLDGAIGNIRFYNEKAEKLAKDELERMGVDGRLAANPTGIYGRAARPAGLNFEKKA